MLAAAFLARSQTESVSALSLVQAQRASLAPCGGHAISDARSCALRAARAVRYQLGEPLQHDSHSLTAADAHRLQAELDVPHPHRIQQRGHDPRAGAAERMTERDRSAMHVEPFKIDTEIPGRRNHLDRERLIDLHQIDVVDRHPGAGQGSAAGLNRSQSHDLRAESADACCNDARQRGEAELGRTAIAHDHHCSRPVVQRDSSCLQ